MPRARRSRDADEVWLATIAPFGLVPSGSRFAVPSSQGHESLLQNGKELAAPNILCVLYDDPIDGYPPSYARSRFDQWPGSKLARPQWQDESQVG